MAETFFPQVTGSISLEEFINHVESTKTIIDLKNSIYDIKKMEEMAGWLRKLAANRKLLTEKLCGELKNFWDFQLANDFKPSTIMLHKGDGYTVRALIWMPPGPLYPPEIFSYYETHDHNFDFFTVGYFGPGYRTCLYEYDYESVRGVPGEEVTLKFTEETFLTPNKVMYYYGSRDVHTQYPAEEISVSINLLLPKTQPAHRRQHEFSTPEAKGSCTVRLIAGRIDRMAQERALFYTIAAIGDKESLNLIRDIAVSHQSEATRALAWASLLEQSSASEHELTLALHDSSSHVRAVAKKAYDMHKE